MRGSGGAHKVIVFVAVLIIAIFNDRLEVPVQHTANVGTCTAG